MKFLRNLTNYLYDNISAEALAVVGGVLLLGTVCTIGNGVPKVGDMHTHLYTVHRGDTLSGVCETYIEDTNMYNRDELMYQAACDSNLEDTDKIREDQKLLLRCDGGKNCPDRK